jgi:hypothetical protein
LHIQKNEPKMNDQDHSHERGPAQLRTLIDALRSQIGDDDQELIKQTLADLNALDRQKLQNHFEARLQYAKHVAEGNRIAHEGIREYGLQTLKWAFLLNAGAIGVVLGYVSGILGGKAASSSPETTHNLLAALWPFAVGCVMVVLAGAAGFFNFSYAEACHPSAENLQNFMANPTSNWPIARLQGIDETPADFRKRFSWRVDATRSAAISFAIIAAAFFAYGVYRVWTTAVG